MSDIGRIHSLFSQFIGTLFEDQSLLVFCFCFVVGFLVKSIRQIPSESIPIIVTIWGALSTVVLDTHHTEKLSLMAEKFAAAAVGTIIGFSAWVVHRYLWKPILKKITSKFGGSLEESDLCEPERKSTPDDV